MKPVEVSWSGGEIAELLRRVRAYRFPPAPRGGGWRYGCDPDYLRAISAHWAGGFDFRAAEAELNRFPQFIATLGRGARVHFIHLRGEAGGRRPLLLASGWPGSIFEFWRVVEPRAFPSRHGGRAADAFDVVPPSLPGYGRSFRPIEPVGPQTTARIFDSLMRELGYDRYLAHGTDWGAGIVPWMALHRPDAVCGIHLHHLPVQPHVDPGDRAEAYWRRDAAARRGYGGYHLLQTTKPQSLAYAMEGNPLAQAAWLIERFHDWSDLRERDFDAVFGRDWLLTAITDYLMTASFTTATWFYAGAESEGAGRLPEGRRVEVPTAFTSYPAPNAPNPPRSVVERGYAVVRWREAARGGHFAAAEVPEAVVDDLRGWAAALEGNR